MKVDFLDKNGAFFKTYFTMALVLFIIKVVEYLTLLLAKGINLPWAATYGLFTDLSWLAVVWVVFFLPAAVLPRAGKFFLRIYQIVAVGLISFNALDTVAFLKSGVPMDFSLFVLGFNHLWFTVEHSLRHPFMVIILFLMALSLIFWLAFKLTFRLSRKKQCPEKCLVRFAVLWAVMAVALPFTRPQQSMFSRDTAWLTAKNKIAYLWKSYHDFYNGSYGAAKGYNTGDIDIFHRDMGVKGYINKEYPFLHIDREPDILGPFFKHDSTPPDVVFVACESLSAAFFGPHSRFGNFVPFLDSLSRHSLYWPNCLSTTERTFGVLPALLGSLPQAKKGFNALAGSYPKHLTLMSILKRNGYHTAWFHGGPLGFDYMYDFIKAQHPDYVFNADGGQTIANDAENKEVSWGLYDDVLFKKSLAAIQRQNASPRFDVFLTLTTHAPYNIPDRDFWERKFDSVARLLPQKQREEAEREKYRLSAFLYLDHSLQQLVSNYLRTTGTDNVIFVITGDHRMGTLAANELEKYHVPLIIWSPRLKRSKTFQAVATHYAVTPSFNAFFKKQYHIYSPDTVAWVTPGLDTAGYFRNIYSYAFMRNSRVVEEYLHHDYYLFSDKLFKIGNHLKIKEIKDQKMKQEMKAKMRRYEKYNLYACFNDRLFPYRFLTDSLRSITLIDRHWKEEKTINANDEYVTILPKYVFDDAREEKITLDLSMNIQFTEASPDSLPRIVIVLRKKNGEHIHYWAILPALVDGSPPKPYRSNYIHLKKGVDFRRDRVENGAELKVYFWNINRSKMTVNYLNVKLSGYEKPEDNRN